MARPQRRPVNLENIDTGHVVHNLYVKIAGDEDAKSRELTKQALRFIHARLPVLREMGLRVQVNQIRARDLLNPLLRGAMEKRGIKRLPALTTPNDTYLGVKEIADIYDRNIKAYEAQRRREEKTTHREMDNPEAAVDDYYRQHLNFDKWENEQDSGDEAMGETHTEAMMRSYNRMMQRRDQSSDRNRPPTGRTRRDRDGQRDAAADIAPPGAGPAPPRRPGAAPQAAGPRPDNVQKDDDDEISGLIANITREPRGEDHQRAYAAHGGDSLSGDGENDAGDSQDKVMESMFWANQEDSLN